MAEKPTYDDMANMCIALRAIAMGNYLGEFDQKVLRNAADMIGWFMHEIESESIDQIECLDPVEGAP